MYKQDEKLLLTEGIGKEDSPNFLPKGTEVVFVKVVNPDCSDLSSSLVIVSHNDRSLVIKESSIRIKSIWRRMRAVAEINEGMFKTYPRLRRNHHNIIKKVWYRTYYFIADKIAGKEVDGIEKVEW